MPNSNIHSLQECALRIQQKVGAEFSGFRLTESNAEALNWRLMLINLAQTSIDIQSYLWNKDGSGYLVIHHLLEAADRGVYVRVLIDDLAIENNDMGLSALSSHPNIDIKLFNPTVNRMGWRRMVEMITEMGRLNHRMHNKLFVVDDHAAILGSRNVGDEYFGLHPLQNFVDLDTIVFGPVVQQVKQSFQTYWKSRFSITIEEIVRQDRSEYLDISRGTVDVMLKKYQDSLVSFPTTPQSWDELLHNLQQTVVPGTAESLQDDPSDLKTSRMMIAAQAMNRFITQSQKELLIASPYFIPGQSFFRIIRRQLRNRVDIKVLTNSLMTNNHIEAHSGYIKYRRKTIRSGIELYELHDQAKLAERFDTPPVQSHMLCMHAKAVIIDRRLVFIGSLNFDPRAIYLNTEVGLLIESPPLAERLAELFQEFIHPRNSWQVQLDPHNTVIWKSDVGVFTREPTKDRRQATTLAALTLLPIEKQL